MIAFNWLKQIIDQQYFAVSRSTIQQYGCIIIILSATLFYNKEIFKLFGLRGFLGI